MATNLIGQSTQAAVAGVQGENTAPKGRGVVGISTNGTGVFGSGEVGVRAESINGNAIWATAENNDSILGIGKSGASGVVGTSETGSGVRGETGNGTGVSGSSRNGAGVRGTSVDGRGVEGWSTKSEGVVGISTNSTGVWGQTEGTGTGVLGTSKGGVGVWGASETYEGMHAETRSPVTAAIAAYNLNPAGTGAAIFAKKEGTQGHAGFFDGNVWISGELAVGKDIILANADCAEDFDVFGAVKVEPGTVMVLGDEGALFESHQAYDKRVAGVISGAGDYKPGIVLDKRQTSSGNRQPVALLGKVFCRVDAQFGAIEVGDLLTTSSTPGHAMRADDPMKAFGTVIGKALRPLKEGQGLIPILVSLQ